MASEEIGLVAAILFLLIAVVGGGFTVRELSIPTVPKGGRLLSGLLGLLFAVPFALSLATPADDAVQPAEDLADDAVQPAEDLADEDQVALHSDDQPDTSPQSIRLLEVGAASDSQEPTVGDRIIVGFTLQNVGEAPFQLAYTFIGARNPTDENRDFGEGNHAMVLEPGQRLTVESSIVADEPGLWVFWPCYVFEQGGEEHFCPDRWKGFQVLIRE